ncbi:MAG: adenosylhomocysteinase [Bryobacteraceae bacterium]
MKAVDYDVKDLALAEGGKRRIEWAFQSMAVLQSIRKQFIRNQPLAGIRIATSLHLTTETANLLVTLRDGGATVAACAPNPLTTQDDVAASLVKDYGISVWAIRGADPARQRSHVDATLATKPAITTDAGCGLLSALHERHADLLPGVTGGAEETATGVARVKQMAREGKLAYPVIAINDASTKTFFDNRYGTGQSTIDGLLRATNILLAGTNVVIGGYGWCGRGVATRARGLGANVIVTEVDPIKALEAVMDGYRVMSMGEAAAAGDVFITVTGNKSVIAREHFEKLKSGAILCNSGHYDVEIDLAALERMASSKRHVREFVEEYVMKDGRRIFVLGEGRLINLASGEGHPAAVMDVSFANLALSVQYLAANHAKLDRSVYPVPERIDREVARMKLDSMGIKIDKLTQEQERFLGTWPDPARANS